MPIAARVQNQADGNTVQPSSSSRSTPRPQGCAAGCRRSSSGQHRERILLPARIGAGNIRQQPAGNLPIAANPAMPAADIRAVAGWIFLVQLHIAQQPGPGVTPFQKIVAEDPVFGKAPFEGPFECIHIIDALADERAFTEQVLVNIGDGPRIRIDAGSLAHMYAYRDRFMPAGSPPPVAAGCRTPQRHAAGFRRSAHDSAGGPWRPQTATPNRVEVAYRYPG
jgi:hypothetical protein